MWVEDNLHYYHSPGQGFRDFLIFYRHGQRLLQLLGQHREQRALILPLPDDADGDRLVEVDPADERIVAHEHAVIERAEALAHADGLPDGRAVRHAAHLRLDLLGEKLQQRLQRSVY